ncbi:MAG: DUF3575 domain-containing protein [Prevotella sp.]|nr:DUF3575 domain-containing protein [Prevotella sp.]
MILSNGHSQAQIESGLHHRSSVVLKNNLIHDATTTLNFGAEFYLSRKFTLDIPFDYNPWTFSNNKKIKHWLVQPELRYWINKSFDGSFWGIHLHGSQFNTANIIDRYRYEGWLSGVGISFGHQWHLSDRWAIEATLGVGYAYIDYTKYTFENKSPEGCRVCGQKLALDNKHYWGPTRIGLSISYVIGKTEKRRIEQETTNVIPVNLIRPQIVIVKDTVRIPVPRQDTVFNYQEETASILFPEGQSTLLPEFMNNREELDKIDLIVKMICEIPNIKIKNISIESFASPEGELDYNLKLSERRAEALRDYMIVAYDLDINFFSVRSRGENWNGLRSAIITSGTLTANEKTDILHILNIEDLPVRKAMLKKYNGSKIYNYLKHEIYPALRISKYRIDYAVPTY